MRAGTARQGTREPDDIGVHRAQSRPSTSADEAQKWPVLLHYGRHTRRKMWQKGKPCYGVVNGELLRGNCHLTEVGKKLDERQLVLYMVGSNQHGFEPGSEHEASWCVANFFLIYSTSHSAKRLCPVTPSVTFIAGRKFHALSLYYPKS